MCVCVCIQLPNLRRDGTQKLTTTLRFHKCFLIFLFFFLSSYI